MSLSQMPWMSEKWRCRKKHRELKRHGCCHSVCILWAVGPWVWDCVQMTRIQFSRTMIWKDRYHGGTEEEGQATQAGEGTGQWSFHRGSNTWVKNWRVRGSWQIKRKGTVFHKEWPACAEACCWESKFIGVDCRGYKEVKGDEAKKLSQGLRKVSLWVMIRDLDFPPS